MPSTLHARAILLDMDGTLVDSTAAVTRAWRDWGLQHDVDFARIEPLMHGRQARETMALLLPHRAAADNIADNAWMLRRESTDLDGVTEIAGAGALLSALHGLPHALVTSADTTLMRARMGAAGLTVPSIAVTAGDVVASKPDPEGFLRAAALLHIAPADCVVFEDSAAGIAAGRAAGMRVVAVAATAPEGTVAHVADLTEVSVDVADGDIRLTLSRG